MSQFLIVVKEEGEVLIRNIHVCVPPKFSVLFNSVSSARKGILVDLWSRILADTHNMCFLFIDLKRTLCLICFMVSVRKIEVLGSDALILDWAPCRAGKKVE